MESIHLRNVETNNLKNISVDLPLGQLTVVTGVSGSGKSSLVFDTLYGEAYRRYVESLSSFARQYLKALPKPKLSSVENLPPSIAVKQARSGATSRSTVGTMTEIADLLRVLFTYFSEIICPSCNVRVHKYSADEVSKEICEEHPNEKILVLAPLRYFKGIKPKELKINLMSQGFTRVSVEGKFFKLGEIVDQKLMDSFLVIDRFYLNEKNFSRLVQAVTLAFKIGKGHVSLGFDHAAKAYVSFLGCPACERQFTQPSLALFSFNHPFGACPGCQGFGFEPCIDWEKVFPDMDSNLSNYGVAPWNFGSHDVMYREAKTAAKLINLDPKKKFFSYSPKEWEWLKFGDAKKFGGVREYFEWLESKRHKAHYRIHAARFRKYVICSKCNGGRLNPDALACRLDGLNFAQVVSHSIDSFDLWLRGFSDKIHGAEIEDRLSEGVMGISEAMSELGSRVNYLKRVGLGYLNIDRQTRTLSGGEQQRINMARCLGSALTDTMYCLDEPTAGLHAKDSSNLLDVLFDLRNQGNTVVVVEHEKTIIEGADYLLHIGPEAGHKGGELVFQGKPKHSQPEDYFFELRRERHKKFEHWIEFKHANTNNLKNASVKIPVGSMTVVCGVSGSGKTSLVQHTIYPALARILKSPIDGYVSPSEFESVGPAQAISLHERVVHVSQTSLGRSSRSTIATYLGIFDEIRKVLEKTPEARRENLSARDFSFNTSGGRCENCCGLGTIVEDLSFLGEMEVICPVCDGKRFKENVLRVKFREKSLYDLLQMTVAELRELFFDFKSVVKVLDNVIAMGLGYMTIGQGTSSFSGGEAQRLKLLRLLAKTKNAKPSFLIFDEPTTGLSDSDVRNLIKQFRQLVAMGHTVLIVEHHLGLLRCADWLIEVGPGAADKGGSIVFQGFPDDLRGSEDSVTAKYMFKDGEVKH